MRTQRYVQLVPLLLLASSLSLLGPLLASCAAAQPVTLPVPREETLVIVRPGYEIFDTWNPFVPRGVACEAFGQIINEYLWYINYATGDVIYWLITGWEYKDNYTTFILHVRPGVTWSDGKPFTSRDIAFTINMVKGNPKLYWNAWAQRWVKSVETPDDYTCVIHLTEPNPRFHFSFRGWAFPVVPEHIWKDKDPVTFKNNPPIGTGPYVLYKVIPEAKMFVFVRRDDYWAAKVFGPQYLPKPKYIVYRAQTSADAEYAAWIRGDIDAFLAIDVMSVEMVKKGLTYPETSLCPFLDPCPRGLWINTQKYPLNYSEVRWALAYLFNREKLAEFWPAVTVSKPAKYPWADWAGLRKYAFPEVFEKYKLEYNPKKAAELLDKLGIVDRDGDGIRETPNGTKMSFVLYQAGGFHLYLAEHLAEEARKIGIEIIVKPTTSATWDLQALGQIDMNLYWLCTSTPWNNDPYYLLEPFHSKYAKMYPVGTRMLAGSWVRLVDPELDKIIDELSTIPTDSPRGLELLKKGLEIWMRDLPAIPIVETIFEMGWSTKYWTGWPTPDNFYLWPPNWWPEFLFVILNLKPARVEYTTVWFTKDTPKFVGYDGREYGPFRAGDSARIPTVDADRIVKEGVATLTPLVPGLEELKNRVVSVESTLAAMRSELAGKIETLSSTVGTLTALATLALILSLAALIASLIAARKKTK
ncbi:MAG: ABC transporter substrate-binding protein [Thermofilum sp.]|nr:ABC transporter substrate-binding protein [Thermofilum sp.]MCC6064693.1 ABC transporter substrate-binding protein [Thermofilum sp.]